MSMILVPLADGFEELEAVTLIDLLRRAGDTICVASLGDREVRGNHGISLMADARLNEVLENRYEMIALPGGLPGAHHLRDDARLKQLLLRHAESWLAALCAAPLVLAAHGLLDGKRATSYPGQLTAYPKVIFTGARVESDGKRITGRGPGVALDFALKLIESLHGQEKRVEVEDRLQR